jgi:hypothetical protein
VRVRQASYELRLSEHVELDKSDVVTNIGWQFRITHVVLPVLAYPEHVLMTGTRPEKGSEAAMASSSSLKAV